MNVRSTRSMRVILSCSFDLSPEFVSHRTLLVLFLAARWIPISASLSEVATPRLLVPGPLPLEVKGKKLENPEKVSTVIVRHLAICAYVGHLHRHS